MARNRRYRGRDRISSVSTRPIRTGALERRDPIPPGYYWIDSIDPAAFAADRASVEAARGAYLEAINTSFPGALESIRTVHHDKSLHEEYARDWHLFHIKQTIPRWDLKLTRWGFPNIALKGAATQESDTVQKPPPEKGGLDFGLGDGISLGTGLLIGGAIVGGLLLIKVLS